MLRRSTLFILFAGLIILPVCVFSGCQQHVPQAQPVSKTVDVVPAPMVNKAEAIESDVLTVQIDNEFPRIVKYIYKATGDQIQGQHDKLEFFIVNGAIEKAKSIKFSKTASSAEYSIRLHNFSVKIVIEVIKDVVEFKVTEIRDGGYHNLKTLSIPNHGLITVGENEGGKVAVAVVKPTTFTGEEFFDVKDMPLNYIPVTQTYIIANTNTLAAAMYNNVLLDRARMCYQTVQQGTEKVCKIWNTEWTYRQIEKEIVALPMCRIIITPDRNTDGIVDWQDGAIAYRDIMDSPFGSDDVKNNVVSQIAMNFASLAQHPFLRAFDAIKMVNLYTDGLGQCVQFKGYHSEGHDSAHPDYGNHFNERAGGQKDLKYVVDNASKYNCQVGVHINVTEYYPEAKHYSDDLLTGKYGWAWLDKSIYADKRYDIISGNLYNRLDELKDACPNLSWLYVDVYFGEGWDSWKLIKKMHELGWAMYTEFESLCERDAVWIHRSQKPSGLGVHGRLIRFIRNHQQDVWLHNDLLRGSYNLGFLGWHAENDVNAFVYNVFTNNLPTKYLQHFKIMRWTDDRVDFENNVYSAREDGAVNIYKDNKLVATGRYDDKKRRMVDNLIFLPWEPVRETKIYHFNDAGGTSRWQLPDSWDTMKNVYLYELTPIGRKLAATLPVNNGKILIDAKAKTPYVLYKTQQPEPQKVAWGQGAPVADPGFDSCGFDYWNKTSSASDTKHIYITADDRGQSHLEISGNRGADGKVIQKITGLKGGKRYSASVWVELKGKRNAYLGVKTDDGKDIITKITKTDIPNNSYCGDKWGTNYQRIRLFFDVPEGQSSADIYLGADKGAADSIAAFDDVRVVQAPKRNNKGHYFYEDFEWTDEGWGPFVFAIHNDTHTHLSELHKGYTNDTINGKFSLKTRNERQGLVYRSTPALLKLDANTKYKLTFQYLQDNDAQYSVVVRTDDGKDSDAFEVVNSKLSGSKGTFEATFKTAGFDDYYIGIVKNDKKPGVMVVDDLAIDIIK